MPHRISRLSNTHRYIQIVKSQDMLAQHYAETAYAILAYSAKLTYRTVRGKHTINASSKPAPDPAIFLVTLSKTPDATFGLIRNENDSVWFRVNAKSISESFGIQSVWMRDGIIRTERGMARYHSEWLYAIKRIQTEWEFYSDWCGIIRNKLETSIRTKKKWIVIGRSHSDFHYEWVRASETDFAFIHNRSEWIGDIRIETESIFIPKLAAG